METVRGEMERWANVVRDGLNRFKWSVIKWLRDVVLDSARLELLFEHDSCRALGLEAVIGACRLMQLPELQEGHRRIRTS